MNILYALTGISMFITLIIMIIGIILMAIGTKLNEKYSNYLMTARVAFQAITICMLGIVYLVK